MRIHFLHTDAKWLYALFGTALVLLLFLMPDSGFDKYYWITWTQHIIEHGLGSIYTNPDVNNHPLILYLLKLFSFLFQDSASVTYSTVNRLKALVLPFDLLTLMAVVHILKRTQRPLWGVMIFFLNPAFWYNTVIWGQVDTIHTFFVLGALIFAERGQWRWAGVALLIAINFKLQAIIFTPLVMVFIMPFIRQRGWAAASAQIFILAGVQMLVFTPFWHAGKLFETLIALTSRSIDHFPVLSRNAYNFWHFVVADPYNFPDRRMVLGVPLKIWGLVQFWSASAMIMMPMVLAVGNGAFDNLKREERLGTIFQVSALVTMAFFLFNTQMHERYIHPALLFSGLFALLTGRGIVFGLVTTGYLLNMEAVMRYLRYFDEQLLGFKIDYERIFLFEPKFIAGIFIFAFLYGAVEFYRTFFSFKTSGNNVTESTRNQ
jgi:Gpi18-like mannosyltransferase